jgi:hypothetical protein
MPVSSERLIIEKCQRVAYCTHDYYSKHGKWPSCGDLSGTYLGIRSYGYCWSSATWWSSWRNEAIARGILSEGQGTTDEHIKKIIVNKLNR